MLTLTRRASEAIRIVTREGDRIELVLLAVGGGKCRLGFRADPSIKILRGELYAAEDRRDAEADRRCREAALTVECGF